RVLRALASLRLTVTLFGLAMALVFLGTLGMTQDSIENTVKHYFRNWIAWVDVQGVVEFGKVFFGLDKDAHVSLKVPFPGGYTIGWVMFFNLLAAHAVRFKLTWKRSGIFLLHAGVIVLLAGEFLTGLLQVETKMVIKEGESADYATSLIETELAAIDTSDPAADHVVSVPGEMVAGAADWFARPDLPFEFRVVEYFPNSDIADVEPGAPNKADRGFGQRTALVQKPKVKGTDASGEINYPAAYLELRDKEGKGLGTYLFTTMLRRSQPVTVGGKTYDVAFRFRRTYKPFQVHLIKAEHDVYAGTNTPKDFASTVLVKDPELGEHGPIRIWMNHPMTYRGETFYQSQMDTDKNTGVKTTGLQVVRNPAWTAPYLACIMVALGMSFHFLIRLLAFLQRGAGK
ncbi:MAG: cytochrome c biogenesis protein ResB, partial [Zavarzinella sp.]|nr:cytochrome c biogenesis protein ResB [Zavarzinella sp.]